MIEDHSAKTEKLIEIHVNGEQTLVDKGFTVASLLVKKAAQGPGVAVELNQQVIPRVEHVNTVLNDGDEVEIVRLVGGG